MRSLFLKIFLWFWLTVVVVGVALAASVVYSANRVQLRLRTAASSLLPEATKAAAEEFERGGETALARYFTNIEAGYPVLAFLFDRNGRELLRHDPPPLVRIAATATEGGHDLYLLGNIAAQGGPGPSGENYSLVLLFNPLSPVQASKQGLMKFATLFLPVITLIVGGLFCYLITRHITAPLLRLRGAAASMTQGNLDTRVGPAIGARRDEIGQLGRDFDRMAERIEALVDGHKRMLGDVSHELRSPLSRLVVALGLAKKSGPHESAEYLDRIAAEARRPDGLIGQLLTLSCIDSGSHTAAVTSFDLANLVHEVAGDAGFEARSRSRQVVVLSAASGDECAIRGSEELLRSAIENIVRNAVRFTLEGTSVEITLQREAGKPLLRVRDHGPGVPENMLSEIFLPFRRVPASAEAPSEGAGLGLAIAQRAVAMNGGTIRALNAKDGGLIVEVEFPAITG